MAISKIEDSLSIGRGTLSKTIAKKGSIGSQILENFLKIYPNVNPSWILTGNGDMEIGAQMAKRYKDIPKRLMEEVNNMQKKPLLPIEAFAGKGLGVFDDLKIERYYDVYEFRSADFLISVKGSSMYPKYNSGDILACKLVKDRLFIQWNKTHVIYSNSQGAMVKRLCKGSSNDFILCKSDNKDYEPFEIPTNDIGSMAIVIGVIRLE